MDQGEKDFAAELVRAFGEDRVYHAMFRGGEVALAKKVYEAMGGDDSGWDRLRWDLKLVPPKSDTVPYPRVEAATIREYLCRTAFILSKHHKEFARRSPVLPASIHARMLLDEQNEWTRKYAESLKDQEGQ